MCYSPDTLALLVFYTPNIHPPEQLSQEYRERFDDNWLQQLARTVESKTNQLYVHNPKGFTQGVDHG